MNFKQWLYNESFELPFDNIRKIYEYYEESYKKYLKAPRTKIPPKTIPLDLSGSKYDFLQYLDPTVEVELKGSLPAGVPGDYSNGKIRLSFQNHEYVNYSTIEHEVLHYLQDLFKKHAKKLPRSSRPADKRKYRYLDKDSTTVVGGLPNIPLVKRIMKKKGIKDVDGIIKDKRTKHEHRPIEFYTNLNSLIRSLQYYYIVLGIELGKGVISNNRIINLNLDGLKANIYEEDPDWFSSYKDPSFVRKMLSWTSNKRNKQLFLNKLINRKDHVVRNLEKIKNLDEELYKIYLREIYKNFIDNDNFASNASEVKKIIDSMEQSKKEKEIAKETKQRKKSEKKEKLGEKVLLGDWTEADFTGRITITYPSDYSDIYDEENLGYSNSEIAEEMFGEIGMKTNDNYEIKFGISAKNLTKIFANIKKAKKTFVETDIGKELGQTKINNNFDYMAKTLAETISRYLRSNSEYRPKYPSAEDILNIFYN
jgi:hypothetical protein